MWWPLTLTYIFKVIRPWLIKSFWMDSFYIWHKWSLLLEDVSHVTFFSESGNLNFLVLVTKHSIHLHIWAFLWLCGQVISYENYVTVICIFYIWIICINLGIIGLDNVLSPVRHQVITWTNFDVLLIGLLVTNDYGVSIKVQENLEIEKAFPHSVSMTPHGVVQLGQR